jgi:chorismate-pyruvate lyase
VTPDPQELALLFCRRTEDVGQLVEVAAREMPSPYRELLNHEQHMTVTLESHHDTRVYVEVVRSQQEPGVYSRQSLLRRRSDGLTVQFGIVRLHTDYMDESVRDEIISQTRPLGRVLIEHNVLREVELDRLWKVSTGAELMRHFGLPQATTTYGRTAIIHCDKEPAIELLEIVAPE